MRFLARTERNAKKQARKWNRDNEKRGFKKLDLRTLKDCTSEMGSTGYGKRKYLPGIPFKKTKVWCVS